MIGYRLEIFQILSNHSINITNKSFMRKSKIFYLLDN